eukprot:m.44822 g.44822  ORF g.44822 m.44822 type:complete len:758 (+) comp12371_c0_seq1:117-2390(+)
MAVLAGRGVLLQRLSQALKRSAYTPSPSCQCVKAVRRHAATAAATDAAVHKMRNIGIMAHIDAGKTTTTERMLYFSGATKYIGNVDDGNTQTDFLPEERDRGITIKAAAITFDWKSFQVNLIDTPGHVDFTLEVERALRVLDGAVTVFDGVRGVEAQTLTVWRQAAKHAVPCVAFVNKLDREGASLEHTVSMITSKLRTTPLVLHMPLGLGAEFTGLVDLVSMTRYVWDSDGMHAAPATADLLGNEMFQAALAARQSLCELLADKDDAFAEMFLNVDGDHTKVTDRQIKLTVRALTLRCAALPVLCGAARREKGIEPLLDAVVDFLPSPLERPPVQAMLPSGHGKSGAAKEVALPPNSDGPLCALCFKVTHDPHRGPLVFLRVYSGVLTNRATVQNCTRGTKERTTRILRVMADAHVEVPELVAGDIGAVVGWKDSYTGDTIVATDSKQLRGAKLKGIDIPQPVFTCSIECESTKDEPAFEHALACLVKEDPSLRVSTDEETKQRLLSGMGELHLDVTMSIMQSQFGVKARTGAVQVSYRERPTQDVRIVHRYDRTIGGKALSAEYTLRVDLAHGRDNITVDTEAAAGEEGAALATLPKDALLAAQQGLEAAASRGLLLSYPLIDCAITLEALSAPVDATLAFIASGAADALRAALRSADIELLQPVMDVQVVVPENDVGAVIADLGSSRNGNVTNVAGMDEGHSCISAEVPLKAMVGYSSALRSLTSGAGTFSLEFARYAPLSQAETQQLTTGGFR